MYQKLILLFDLYWGLQFCTPDLNTVLGLVCTLINSLNFTRMSYKIITIKVFDSGGYIFWNRNLSMKVVIYKKRRREFNSRVQALSCIFSSEALSKMSFLRAVEFFVETVMFI